MGTNRYSGDRARIINSNAEIQVVWHHESKQIAVIGSRLVGLNWGQDVNPREKKAYQRCFLTL
jgi:hypothetical protein